MSTRFLSARFLPTTHREKGGEKGDATQRNGRQAPPQRTRREATPQPTGEQLNGRHEAARPPATGGMPTGAYL